ncbi:hypothetical protein HDU67_008801 [Dinochytrium kinnereticum]|nr:hypothetical protein HDU67_008801 [Dinochytrium kinnereticum]
MNIVKGSGTMLVGNSVTNFYQDNSTLSSNSSTVPTATATTTSLIPTTSTSTTRSLPPVTIPIAPPASSTAAEQPTSSAADAAPTGAEEPPPQATDPPQSPEQPVDPAPVDPTQPTDPAPADPPPTDPPPTDPPPTDPPPTDPPPSDPPVEGGMRRREVEMMRWRRLERRNSLERRAATASGTAEAPFMVNALPAFTGINMLFLAFGALAAFYLPLLNDDMVKSKGGKYDSFSKLNGNTMSTTKSGYEDTYEMKPPHLTPPPDYGGPLSPSARTMALLEGSSPDSPRPQKGGNDVSASYPNSSFNRPNGPPSQSGRYGDDMSMQRGIPNMGAPTPNMNQPPPGRYGGEEMDMFPSNGHSGSRIPGAGSAPRLYGDDHDSASRSGGMRMPNPRSRDTLYTVAGGDEYSEMGSEPSLGRGYGGQGRLEGPPPPVPGLPPNPQRQQQPPPQQQQRMQNGPPSGSFDRPYGGGQSFDRPMYGGAGREESGDGSWSRGDERAPYNQSASRQPQQQHQPYPPQRMGGGGPPSQANSTMKKEPKVRCKTCGDKMLISQSSSHVCATRGDGGDMRMNPPPPQQQQQQQQMRQPPPQAQQSAPRQHQQDMRPAPGKRMRVVKRYVPKLDDEVYLEVGDTVEIEDVFEDGWGCGMNVTSSESGAFPLSCLDSNKRSAKQRVQSMYGGGRNRETMYQDDDMR